MSGLTAHAPLIGLPHGSGEEEDDAGDWVMEVVPKTPEELMRIKAAVKANFLFQHLNDAQAKQVYDVMKRVAVKQGDVVIRQGDQARARMLPRISALCRSVLRAIACDPRVIGSTWWTRASTW